MKNQSCMIDSATTNFILRETKYFHTLQKKTENITTIASNNNRIVGSGQAIAILSNNIRIFLEATFLYLGATRTLLTFKDISSSDYQVTNVHEGGVEYLHITTSDKCGTKVVEKAVGISSELYYSRIN